MEIIVTGRHVSVTDALKDYAQGKLHAILDGAHKINTAKVILDVQKTRSKAEIIVHGKNIDIEADAESFDMYKSIDTAVEKVDKQLSKYFDKVQDHHKKKGEAPQAPQPEEENT